MTQDTTTTSGAADLPEALRRSTAADGKTELFNLPGYPLMVRAVDFNRLHTESEMRRAALLDEMQKAALAAGQATAAPAEPDPTPGDHPQPCDSELFESGVSVGLFDIPKWTAEALCKGIAAATGARVDWHYIGGRVHVKALPAPTSAEGVAYAALLMERAMSDTTTPKGQALTPVAEPAYSAACNLATALFKKHFAHLPDFASGQAAWSLCDSTAGVISQIDNMVAGLVQPPTISPQADSVQEDAARYRWLRRWKGQEHEPPFTVQHEIDGTLWGGDLDAAIDAARKQGGKHDNH